MEPSSNVFKLFQTMTFIDRNHNGFDNNLIRVPSHYISLNLNLIRKIMRYMKNKEYRSRK